MLSQGATVPAMGGVCVRPAWEMGSGRVRGVSSVRSVRAD